MIEHKSYILNENVAPVIQLTFYSSSTMSTPIKLSSRADCESFLEKFDTLLLDCDGVLWHEDTVLPGIKEALSLLRQKGKRLIFVTNNSTKSRAAYFAKFKRLNIDANESEIFGSSYVSAYYLKNILNFPKDKKVYVIGESGITEELHLAGIRFCGSSDDDDYEFNFNKIDFDPEVGAVVCGFDTHLNYKKLAKAFRYLNTNPDCIFLLTNGDTTYPANGTIYPGTGSLVAPLIKALNRDPDYVMGKPNKPMLDCIIKKFHLDAERTCMIGDRLDTDIQFGINGKFKTLLVLTGVSKEQEILVENAPIIPDYYLTSLGDLAELCE
ncbi:12562_t:CDS:2 [Acaulospora colombiana]|uniref:12562_t:CDS:1 n=1 Tax=Acaulospora colombiana TaxID=27376 RepID=A0ACA9K2W4_9GLOM|nr:12562_t:CDS:2 [Acaulospora colombiana]